jgi:hypothetical protein
MKTVSNWFLDDNRCVSIVHPIDITLEETEELSAVFEAALAKIRRLAQKRQGDFCEHCGDGSTCAVCGPGLPKTVEITPEFTKAADIEASTGLGMVPPPFPSASLTPAEIDELPQAPYVPQAHQLTWTESEGGEYTSTCGRFFIEPEEPPDQFCAHDRCQDWIALFYGTIEECKAWCEKREYELQSLPF